MRFPPERTREQIRAKYWQTYYRHLTMRRPAISTLRPFIVGGPPRSGTSLLCTLFNAKPNTIISNEPKQITGKRFEFADAPTLLRGFLLETARTALNKRVIFNKVDPKNPGKLTADTFNTGSARAYVPIDISPKQPLAVGVKAPMPLLDNVDAFCKDWPILKTVLIVRDPVRTINSWRHSYGWQRGLEGDPTAAQLHIYGRVPTEGTPLERRAHLWRITIEECMNLVNRHPDRVMVIQYESLLDHPQETMTKAALHVGSPEPAIEIDVSHVRPQSRANYKNLDGEDVAMIERICRPTYDELSKFLQAPKQNLPD